MTKVFVRSLVQDFVNALGAEFVLSASPEELVCQHAQLMQQCSSGPLKHPVVLSELKNYGLIDDQHGLLPAGVTEFKATARSERAQPAVEFEAVYDPRFDMTLSSWADPLRQLTQRMDKSMAILELKGLPGTKTQAQTLVFSALISAFEAFLWETAEYWIEHDDQSLSNVANCLIAIKRLKKVFAEGVGISKQEIKNAVKGSFQSLVWHRDKEVGPIFENGLMVNLKSWIFLEVAREKRHHIVHRSGHDMDKNAINVTRLEINKLYTDIAEFAGHIHDQFGVRWAQSQASLTQFSA